MNFITNFFKFIWRTFWSLVWLSMVIIACGLGLADCVHNFDDAYPIC